MIEITELRIGNKVKCKVSNDAGIYDVLHLNGMGLKVMLSGAREGVWYNGDKLKGIKLTLPILKESGFTWDMITASRGTIWLAPGNGGYDVFLSGLSGGIYCNIKYFHQLQNLYFALTGTELTINL